MVHYIMENSDYLNIALLNLRIMEGFWDNRKYLNDIFYIVGECMMSVSQKL